MREKELQKRLIKKTNCPAECDSVLYETRIEKQNNIDKNENLKERFANYTIDSISQNLTILNFNYVRMEYTNQRNAKDNFCDTLGNWWDSG